jgi:hypothetical protein
MHKARQLATTDLVMTERDADCQRQLEMPIVLPQIKILL